MGGGYSMGGMETQRRKERIGKQQQKTNKPTKIAGRTMKVQKLSYVVWHNACNS